MSTSTRLFTLDTVMIDVVAVIDQLPERGGDAEVRERLVTAGGGFNVMSAARRQGLAVSYVGQLGEGPFATLARTILADEGIDLAVAPRTCIDVGLCFVMVEASGERTFVTAPGAEGTLTAEEVGHVVPRAGDFVFLSGYNLVYPALCEVTKGWLSGLSDEVVVVCDPGPRVRDIPALAWRMVLERTDWLVCNEVEASAITDSSNLDEAVARFAALPIRRGVVVRTGPRGCVLLEGGQEIREVSGYSVEVRDTNGAGDTHGGIFIAELSRGLSPYAALVRANAGSALAIQRIGPATAPTHAEIDEFLATR